MMKESIRDYLPAAGRDWLLPFYDPFVKLLGFDRIREEFVGQSDIRNGHRILDIGCGTGTLLIRIKRLFRDVEAVGIDPDAKALRRAIRKSERAGCSIRYDRGYSDDLPYPDAYFDRVLSSYVFHHIEAEDKTGTLTEIRRVLKPDGVFHMLDIDFSNKKNKHSNGWYKDNSVPRVLEFLKQSGFADMEIAGRYRTYFTDIVHYRGVKL
jgi:ubiquinone/menaquinone biosynthesis C-methylase UbiE